MELIYRQDFLIEAIHADCFRRLKPSCLLYFIQEVAGAHAEQLGAGWDNMARKQMFWALIRHRVEITRLPLMGETITVETWPMPATRVAYPRATVAYDKEGKELFRSTALWVFMDLNTRAMILPKKSGVDVPGILRGGELDTPASIAPKDLENLCVRNVGYTELDRNGHMNNTYYIDWSNCLLPSDFHRDHSLKAMSLCYLSEAREGHCMHLSWQLDPENCLHVDAIRPDLEDPNTMHRVFAAQLSF